MGRNEGEGSEPLAHTEIWGGLEGDLERLQGLLDGAVEVIRTSFVRISEAADAAAAGSGLRGGIGEEARRVITCLQFHDIASQLIANMRNRAALLELAALTAAPGAAAEERAMFLSKALQLSKCRPGQAEIDHGGAVDLF